MWLRRQRLAETTTRQGQRARRHGAETVAAA